MALISLQEITLAFGGPLIFDRLSLQLEPGERVALLGRNGAGKTTLMKVIAGQLAIDKGKVICQKGFKVAHLPQEVPLDIKGNVFDIVLSGLGQSAAFLADYHHLSHRLQSEHTPELMRRLDRLQSEMDRTAGWDLNNQVEYIITKMKLDSESEFELLSGGQKRRVLLAKALVFKPDVLLLDEPTNHLDIESIGWLEKFLLTYPGTVFFVTHDRMFMTNLAKRIIELDRGKLFSWACDYKTFLERRQMALDMELVHQENFNKKLAQEEIWIRQGVKARRCRNEGRVKALERLREEKKAQRKEIGEAHFNAQKSGLSGHRVIKAVNVNFSYADNCLIRDFSTRIMRGDKIGVIGPNGCGKTTLLRILLGEIPPRTGKVVLGTNLEIAYYDQLREQLEEDKTVIENVSTSGEMIIIDGKPRHIISYLQNFLFSPDRARSPAKVLSGGERNRLFLARLFSKPFNLLVMDEPTNDLDIETLELLEELLLEYSGTLLLVSHDRSFLNNVVTSTMALEGNGLIKEYPGGYDDWLSQSKPVIPREKPKVKAGKDISRPD
ncbi:MAG: ATP-binding cassette domain-containing protein, partial [Candidatus Omnitrophica bacterium]|nr:ATP-binding cassette domain-containing protein [Candidatus Omnitrophota bacterium]MCG2704183.1 ATP-binding cassette domain-containing protein [Candidatus Omnitrophota bacterium]